MGINGIDGRILIKSVYPYRQGEEKEKQVVQKVPLIQGWAINFPKGPHEIVGLLWRAGPIG